MSRAINPVDGTAVVDAAVGPEDAPALLLAHGSALSSAIWRGFGYLAAVRPRYRLLPPDLRGHSRGDKPTDPDCYRNVLQAVFRKWLHRRNRTDSACRDN